MRQFRAQVAECAFKIDSPERCINTMRRLGEFILGSLAAEGAQAT